MKKIIAILIALLLLCSGSTVFAYNDIDDLSIKNAVETLSTFNIINGYEDGSFKPKNNITRAEFAKIITVAMRLENIIPESEETFEDVADDAWYTDYIYVSKTVGIINGTSNTTFEPNSNVTYEQAIKMIVAALGYNQEAQECGGYPNGYLTMASNLGITNNISFESKKFATREDIALLMCNALNSKFYYIVFDGENIERMESDITLYELHNNALKINEAMNNEQYEEYDENLQNEDLSEIETDSVG